jgi:energy-coupling factor transporter ATP-binding protein EcfA2
MERGRGRVNIAPLPFPVDGAVAMIKDAKHLVLVDDVSVSVQKGRVLGLIGESGAGKSTIGLAALSFGRGGVRLTGGQVLLNGRDIRTADASGLRALRGQLRARGRQRQREQQRPRRERSDRGLRRGRRCGRRAPPRGGRVLLARRKRAREDTREEFDLTLDEPPPVATARAAARATAANTTTDALPAAAVAASALALAPVATAAAAAPRATAATAASDVLAVSSRGASGFAIDLCDDDTDAEGSLFASSLNVLFDEDDFDLDDIMELADLGEAADPVPPQVGRSKSIGSSSSGGGGGGPSSSICLRFHSHFQACHPFFCC